MALTIRRATPDDAAITAQHRRLMFEAMWTLDAAATANMAAMVTAFEAYIRPHLRDGSHIYLLAEDDGVVVGGAGIMIVESLPNFVSLDPRRAYLYNVYVAPSHRRQGIARRLLQALIASARALGLSRVDLHASLAGRPLYESLGFRATNEMRLWLVDVPDIAPRQPD